MAVSHRGAILCYVGCTEACLHGEIYDENGKRQPVFKGLQEDKAPDECRCI